MTKLCYPLCLHRFSRWIEDCGNSTFSVTLIWCSWHPDHWQCLCDDGGQWSHSHKHASDFWCQIHYRRSVCTLFLGCSVVNSFFVVIWHFHWFVLFINRNSKSKLQCFANDAMQHDNLPSATQETNRYRSLQIPLGDRLVWSMDRSMSSMNWSWSIDRSQTEGMH